MSDRVVDCDRAERHRRITVRFTELTVATAAWDAPTPVREWVARHVVAQLVGWFRAFLAAGGVQLPPGPDVESNPQRAWQTHAAGVQGLPDDNASVDREFTHPQTGTHRLGEAIDRFYTADVFMHTWDLARAINPDDRLDLDFCAHLLSEMEPIDDVLRSSGHYGPAVPRRRRRPDQTLYRSRARHRTVTSVPIRAQHVTHVLAGIDPLGYVTSDRAHRP